MSSLPPPSVQLIQCYLPFRHVRLSITTHALRAIDLAGGIDNYILGTEPEKLNSIQGEEVRKRLLGSLDTAGAQRAASVRLMLKRVCKEAGEPPLHSAVQHTGIVVNMKKNALDIVKYKVYEQGFWF